MFLEARRSNAGIFQGTYLPLHIPQNFPFAQMSQKQQQKSNNNFADVPKALPKNATSVPQSIPVSSLPQSPVPNILLGDFNSSSQGRTFYYEVVEHII